jgi:DNA invertase Pin-like site-specific DNA recombinase
LAAAVAGDTAVVTRLDWLGRSLPELLALVEDLSRREVGLRSLGPQIDTASAAGRLVLQVLGPLPSSSTR